MNEKFRYKKVWITKYQDYNEYVVSDDWKRLADGSFSVPDFGRIVSCQFFDTGAALLVEYQAIEGHPYR